MGEFVFNLEFQSLKLSFIHMEKTLFLEIEVLKLSFLVKILFKQHNIQKYKKKLTKFPITKELSV